MVDIQKRLNPAQFAAVTALDGPLLVIAGAGSGKTRVIEYRVLHLVQSGTDPRSILLLTFTRRASREMLSRASKHDPRCEHVDGGTFHSFCYKMLKRYGRHIGFTDSFSVMDESDSEEAIRKACARMGLFEQEKRFPKKSTLRNIISVSINKNIPIADVLDREYPHFLKYAKDIDTLRVKYTEYKIAKNFFDYDDLLVYCKLLLDNDQIRMKVSERYKYIMVDEYQDTNSLQGGITYLLGRCHRNVMVVGDDAQSIYGFRGASHENIMRFPKLFPECKIMKLEANYRSTQAILDVGNAVLENMKNKYTKFLVSASKAAGEKPRLIFFKDIYEEAEWIAGKIKEFNDEGIGLAAQAVLFRNLYISIPLQAELSKRGIPYGVFGGLRFYETGHVKDVMAHLKVLANPKDELSWNRILMLIEGIGPKKADDITEEIMKSAKIDIAADIVLPGFAVKIKGGKAILRLAAALKQASRGRNDIGDKFSIIEEYYSPIMQAKFDDWHIRANDLDTMRQISSRYKDLEDLLSDFAIEPPERGVSQVAPHQAGDERPLSISTIHSAKGLEWDVVFLMGVMEGVLPSKFSLHDDHEIEEEQRLFYVAITRAKKNLFLSLHHESLRGGISQFNRISRFIEAPNVVSKIDHTGIDLEEAMYDALDSYLDDKIVLDK